jgi:predicted MFS family arabinose efflux permease
MSDDPPIEKRSPGKLILPSLVISAFATWIPWILTGLLLIDIGLTFGLSVGVTGQIRTISSIVGVISALLLGALSVRFSHRSLLMIGLLSISISALSCSLAPNFNVILLSYSILGLAMAIVLPMSMSLVADHFPLKKRTSAIGWIIAGTALSGIVGAPVIDFIAGLGGWRLAFLGFVLPISLLSLLLAAKGLPSTPYSQKLETSKGSYLEGFKGVFTNRSAVACVIGYALSLTAFQAIGFYSPSFFRQRFLVSTSFASMTISGLYLCLTLGSLISGRLVDRFGRKLTTVLTVFIAGILIISFTNLSNLWLSLALALLGYLFAGILISASHSLALEQVPRFRGTMMSINSAAEKMGAALGAGVGGLLLLLYGWNLLGITLGVIGILAAVIYYLLVIDPTRT